jgi:putative CocE/NonD family hydrolase
MVEDQRFLSGRKDVLSFSTPPLSGDVVVAGPARATLFVSSAGTDADWVVKLIDVFPDSINEQGWGNFPLAGYQMLVRGDVFRGKFRQSYSVPVPFTPNRVTRVSFSLQDVFHRFRRGHRIMVQIQSSWFPLVDRNPQKFLDIYSARPDDFVRATQRVYHTREYPSEIVLPVTHGG